MTTINVNNILQPCFQCRSLEAQETQVTDSDLSTQTRRVIDVTNIALLRAVCDVLYFTKFGPWRQTYLHCYQAGPIHQ